MPSNAALQRCCGAGSLPIDNDPFKSAVPPIAIGKENWLFVCSDMARLRAPVVRSLFATAKLNGLDPARWLADTLEKLATCLNSQIDSLLPSLSATQS